MHGQGVADSHVRPMLEQLEPRLLLDGAGEELAVELFSVSPALFVENQGQWADESVHYAFQGDGANVLFTDAGPIFQVFQREAADEAEPAGELATPDPLPHDLPGEQDYITQSVQFSVHFDGANAASPTGLEQAETYFNYFIGEQADWRSNVPAYETVAYEGLYDGIDLHTWGRRDSLKYEFHVAPGADYGQIQVSYEGIDGLFIDAEGALHVQTALGELIDDAPYIYQVIDGEQVEVVGAFALVDGDTYAFDVTAAYDPTRELVIDPYLSWSTYLGGSGRDYGWDVAADGAGGVYVTGRTYSGGWASGGFDTSYNGVGDAFVAKLSSAGGHLWSTYLGGSSNDYGEGIAADGAGGVYVTGYTRSGGWASGGFDTSYNGGGDAFVAKLSSAGGHLWSTYLGGSSYDYGLSVAGDGAGGVYVTGSTRSPGWASGGFDTSHNGYYYDAFVAKLSSAGGHLWSTYLGGSSDDFGFGVAADAAGAVYVTGYTYSPGWASGGFDTTYNGNPDAFVAKLSSAGGHMWSTYLGGSRWDYGRGVAADGAGGVYVTGYTLGGWASGGFDTSHNGGYDAFVAKLSSAGGHLWSTYLGGSSYDYGLSVAADGAGGVYVTGQTESAGWASGGFDTSYNGGWDAFAAKLSSAGGHLWSTYLGGSSRDWGSGVAADGAGGVYVTGQTESAGWASGGFDTSHNGGIWDAFVAKVAIGELSPESYFFSQNDPRWKDDPMPTDGSTGKYIGIPEGGTWEDAIGCAMTSVAMVLKHCGVEQSPAGDDHDPGALNEWLSNNGGYDAGGGIYWAQAEGYSGGKLDYVGSLAWTGSASDNDHWEALEELTQRGYHVIVKVDYDPSDPDMDTHWVLVTHFEGGAVDDPGNYRVYDPWPHPYEERTLQRFYDSTEDNTFFAMHVYGPHGSARGADLAVANQDVTLLPEGFAQRVSARVRNDGSLPACDVLVRFRDLDTGQTVATEMIPWIASQGSEEVSALWTPGGSGARIEVMVDPWDQIDEASEANNSAVAVYAGDAPLVTGVVANWDGNGQENIFGRFVSGVELWNTFTAAVIDPDGALNIDHVTFTLGPLGPVTDSDPFGGWTADFDVGLLTGETTLEVVAYDAEAHASDPWTGTVHVVPFPAWLGTPGGDDYFGSGHYHLTGLFPEFMEQSFTMPEEMYGIPIPIIGGTSSGFRAGVESTVVAPLLASEEPDCSVEFVAFAEVFGETLLDVRYPPEFQAGYFSLSVNEFDVHGESLALEGFDVTATVTDFPLGYYETPEYPIIGVGIPVLADITLRASAGISANLDAGLTLHFDGSGVGITEAWIGPDITGWGSLIGAGRVLGFDLARAEGSLELTLSPELHYAGGTWEPSLSGSMRIPWEVQAGICPWLCYHAEGYIPDQAGWQFAWNDMLGGAAAAPSLATELDNGADPTVFPMLSGDQDAAGNAMIVRTLDADPAPETTNSDVHFTYRPAGGSWTALAPLAQSAQMLTTPVVAMDGQGGAVAVWVANDLPNDGSVIHPTMSELFQHQDLYAAYFNGTSWSAPLRITDDAYADGQPALACDPATGDALLLWTRSELGDATDRTGFEIAHAAWDHATLSWSSPALLTSDAAGDWSPQVAFNGNSQALAIWTHDSDGDLSTRELAYAEWDGSWSGVSLSGDWTRASEAAVTAAPDGSFLVACVEESDTDETLLTAAYDPTTDTWDAPETVASGGIIQEPRLRVNGSGVAALLWQAVGGDGQNDLLASTRDLMGAGVWTAPGLFTDDTDIEWMPMLLFDDAGDPYSAHELQQAAGVPVPGELAGSPDLGPDVGTAEADLIPDLAVSNVQVEAFQLVEGQGARVMAEVANVGWAEAAATTVQFYIGDPGGAGTLIPGLADVVALAAGDSAPVISGVFALPAGVNDYYAVVAPVAGETELGNNSDYTTAESAIPDLTGPQVAVELQAVDVLPGGTSVVYLTFDEPVVSLLEPDISLVEDTQGMIPPDHVYLAPDGMSATLIFEGGLPAAASADTYTLRVLDNVLDLAGNHLDGDGNGTPGGDYEAGFSVFLPGDATGDGIVDGLDYVEWSNNYHQSGSWQDGDFTGDDYVDGLDYIVWSNNYEAVVPAVPSPGMVGDAVEQEVAATAAAQLPESEVVGEAGRGAIPRSSVAQVRPSVSAEWAHPVAGLEGWASYSAGAPSESDLAGGKEDGRDVPVWPASESSELAVSLPAGGGWAASAVPLNRDRAAAPAGVPAEVEQALLTDTGAAGGHSPSPGLAALEDDLVDVLGLVQLEAPLHA